jgi:hypothetical protein
MGGVKAETGTGNAPVAKVLVYCNANILQMVCLTKIRNFSTSLNMIPMNRTKIP